MKTIVIVFFFQLLISSVPAQEKYVQAVSGRIRLQEVTGVLSHEHIVTNFIGADSVKIPRDNRKAIQTILPHLLELKQSGVNVLFECTPSSIGKNVTLLKELSKRSGIHIVTNTGLYAAVDKKYLPSFAYTEDYTLLAKRWINDFKNGINGTGIRPGFIKIGVGDGPIDSIEEKLLLAAIITSRETGMAIGVHTGDFEAAWSEYKLVVKENYNPEKLIWIHAQNANNVQRKQLAEKGVWISLDGVNEKTIEEYIDAIVFLKSAGLLHRLLISHDD
ncbi:MAG: phosphotriesterase, partial [Sphingobacteriales bacterium]